MENSLNAANALTRLEEPFASKDVKWLVAATSRDGRKGRVMPYADPRAYTDRLNEILIASGWDEGILCSPCLADHTDEEGQTRFGGKGAGVRCRFYPRGETQGHTSIPDEGCVRGQSLWLARQVSQLRRQRQSEAHKPQEKEPRPALRQRQTSRSSASG